MSISIENGRVFVNGKETVNPELIGYAVLDAAENTDNIICSFKEIKDLVSKTVDATFNLNSKIDGMMETLGKAV